MNQIQNAERMLGVAQNASPEEISNAFKAKVSLLTQQNLSANEFSKQLNRLHRAHYLLLKNDAIIPFDTGSNYFADFMNQMNQMFDRHKQFSNIFTQSMGHMEPEIQYPDDNPQSYKYSRSFSKSFKVDKDGNIIGSSHKRIQNNDKVFREDKDFNSIIGKMHIKRYRPDGSIKESEKPFNKRDDKLPRMIQ